MTPAGMIRLGVLAILLAAVAASGVLAAPAAARIDVVQTALRALRVAERAEKAAKRAKAAKVDTTRLVDGGVGSADLADGAVTAGKLPEGPKGETTRTVEGKPYLEVMSGPRNGMFINTSGNVRDGEAFVLVKRKDHELHIYGTGKDRRVIVSRHTGDGATAGEEPGGTTTPATGGVTAPS